MDENKNVSAASDAETPAAPKKVRRVGRVAFALLLIATGVLLLIQQFVPNFDLLSIVRFAPALLIVLGVEILIYSARSDVKVKFDWLSVLGCGFILVVVGCSSLVPVLWNLYGPSRDYAQNRYQKELQDQFYQAMNADSELKSKIRNLQIYVAFNHTESGEYTLQDMDSVSVYVELPENGYTDAVDFAADCRRIADLSEKSGVNADDYNFNSYSNNEGNGNRYSLSFLSSFVEGLTDEQLAQRVYAYYDYDGESFENKADRDNTAAAELREQVIAEYKNDNNDAYPSEDYITEQVQKRMALLFPVSAASEAPAATPETAA